MYFVFRISYPKFRIANFVSRIFNEPPVISYDSPCYTFRDIAYCCIFALHEPSLETVIYITIYQQMHWMFLWYSLLCLTIQNSHLFRNVIQCKTRRKHTRTNLQRQYNLLHSYMEYYCIRWCLQEQYHIAKYMKTVTSIYVLLSISVIQSWTVSISWVSPVSTDWNPCCVAPNFRILQPFYTWMRKHDRTWLLEILASLDAFKILGYLQRLACFTVSLLTSYCAHHVTSVMRLWVGCHCSVWAADVPECPSPLMSGMHYTFDVLHIRLVCSVNSLAYHVAINYAPVPTLISSWMHW